MQKKIIYFIFLFIILNIFFKTNTVKATTSFNIPRKSMKLYDKLDLKDLITTDNNDLRFSSSNEKIISVNNEGIAISNNFGQAIITVSDGESSSSITINSGFYLGIDVSSWNGEVDWKKVKSQGIDFAMIRCSYGWYDENDKLEGKSQDFQYDKQFANNLKGVTDNNLNFGIYHFSYAKNVEEAELEADYLLSALNTVGSKYKEKISLPIAYDIEYVKDVDKSTLTDCAIAFCTKIAKAGYEPMVYANTNYFTNYLDVARLNASLYNLWYTYPSSTPNFDEKTVIKNTNIIPLMWQYSFNGNIDGANTSDGKVDLDVLYMKDRVKVNLFDGNNLIDFIGVNKGETLEEDLPTLEKKGYIFNGFVDENGNNIDESYIFNTDTNLKANYSKIPISSIIPDENYIEVDSVYSKKIDFSVLPEEATLDDEKIVYEIEDKSIASIDDQRNIIPKKDGTTIVKCYLDSNKEVYTNVTINVHLNYVKGDLDKNNLIDSNDASLALYLYKIGECTNEQIKIGDMDGNGLIDSNDASKILEIYKKS